MKATSFVLAFALTGIALLSLPLDDASPAGTASAEACTAYLAEGVDEYRSCVERNCEPWTIKNPAPKCYD